MTETTPQTCAKHPKVETLIKCASCGTPICDQCMVLSPVGYKCRSCGGGQNSVLERPSAAQALAACAVGLLGGALAGAFLGSIGFFSLFLSPLYGRFVGTVMLKVSGRKTGRLMEVLTGVTVLLGGIAVLGWPLWLLLLVGGADALTPKMLPSLLPVLLNPFALISLVLVVAAAVSRLRFAWDYWGF